MLENFHCLTCGIVIACDAHYHFHNVTTHTVEELSTTIIKFLLQAEESLLASTKVFEGLKLPIKEKKGIIDAKKNTDFRRECMDEVIELGPIEGADNLAVQSLFLKSNFTPNSRHIIEVDERKLSQDVIKVLSKELNAAVIHFQKDFLSADLPGRPKKESRANKDEHRRTLTEFATSRKRQRKKAAKNNNNNALCPYRKSLSQSVEETATKSTEANGCQSSKSNVKLVLRSGRTIKSNPKYEDFVYFHDFKENGQSSQSSTAKPESASPVKRNGKNASTNDEFESLPDHSDLSKHLAALEHLNNRHLDLFSDDLNLVDWSLNDELDISIEDLDLPGFDDVGGTLPENQILTIENLLQELDGGGSIEISNIIKENNVDSDTVVLDALSQSGSGLGREMFPDWDQVVSGTSFAQSIFSRTKVSTGDGSKSNYCHICRKQYTNKSHFHKHRQKFHSKSSKLLYKCTTCDKVFVFLAAFEKHVKEHNPNQTFLCEMCGRNFKSLVNLKLHFALHQREKTFQCQFCPNKYFLKYSYLTHLKSHSPQDKYYCEKCHKTFLQKSHFQRHLSKHKTGRYLGWSEDYRCNYCSAVKSSEELRVSKINQNFVTCTKCKKGIYKRYLLENKDYVNLEENQTPDRTECKVCGKYVKHLKKHIREIHLSNPFVQCDVCCQSIKKSSLSAHKHRVHSGVVTRCDHCHKLFKNALALTEHMNKVKKMK